MIPTRLRNFLESEKVDYEVVKHSADCSSQELAESEHVPEKEIAKVVMLKADDQDIMVVLPSGSDIDLEKLKGFIGKTIIQETDQEAQCLFPDCEEGAIPALGRPYEIRSYVDESLLDGGEVYFHGGNHKETVKLNSDEYWRIAQAEVGDFRRHKDHSHF